MISTVEGFRYQDISTEEGSLLSVVFELCPGREIATDRSTGHNVHAAFLDLAKNKDASFARLLHSESHERPFTLSWLNGRFAFEGGYRWLKPDQTYWFRATAFAPDISEFLLDCVRNPPPTIRLLRTEIPVTRVIASGHPSASVDSYGDLYERAMNGKEFLSPHLALRFLTPTAFRSGKRNILFPLPGLVFRTLSRKWNTHAPANTSVNLNDTVRKILDENVKVSRYALRTRMLHFGDSPQIGFMGDLTYLMDDTVPEMLVRVSHLLAEFAFYAGVGYKTTMGMGQVQMLNMSGLD